MHQPLSPQTALAKVIEIAGGPAMVAKALEISSQAVSQWDVAPPARVKRLAELSNGEVSEQELRPDIFGVPQTGRAQ